MICSLVYFANVVVQCKASVKSLRCIVGLTILLKHDNGVYRDGSQDLNYVLLSEYLTLTQS